jgi:predicted nucleic acid-binding protein
MGHLHQEAKRKKANELILEKPFGVSGQVLAEFYTNVTSAKKTETPLSPLAALEWIERLSAQPCVSVDSTVVRNGIRLSQRYQINYWDGAILAAAETLGVDTLYTEDLNHGQMYGSVRAENPFLNL